MEVREFLDEGKRYIEQGNPVQASEKLYKAAEEAVKALAQAHANGVWKEVEEKGRWTSPLLFKAITSIAKDLKDEEIRRYWNTAWTLHVEGFHEARLDIDYVREQAGDIEELVKLAETTRGWGKPREGTPSALKT
ncbi:MAG: hypothetical protein COS88_03400 [Chloroflexi bacterium CG07_land_8_20_14_0_80_51_10]|nr:MAG: hypothetical protein COS88_03400 [Chloroflexi bacterium CG07_land_8_20_14_0_80_51_10]